MKKKTDKAKKTEEKRKERRQKIVSSIRYLLTYFVSILWMVIAVRGSLEKSEDWMLANIIGSIWLLIAVISSK